MADWSTDDPTAYYGGTFYLPSSVDNEGIYLLEEDRPPSPRNFQSPIERYGPGGRTAAEYREARHRARAPPQGFYGSAGRTPGDARQLNDLDRSDYTEEVAGYYGAAGPVWGGTIPRRDPRRAAFPVLPNSQAMDIVEGFTSAAGAMGAGAVGGGNATLKYVVLFVLVCVLVLLVVGVVRQGRQIRKLLKETMLLLRAARGNDSPDARAFLPSGAAIPTLQA